jgi:hypothetical protein
MNIDKNNIKTLDQKLHNAANKIVNFGIKFSQQLENYKDIPLVSEELALSFY